MLERITTAWRGRGTWGIGRWTWVGAVAGLLVGAIFTLPILWFGLGPGVQTFDSGFIVLGLMMVLGFPLAWILPAWAVLWVPLNWLVLGTLYGLIRGLRQARHD